MSTPNNTDPYFSVRGILCFVLASTGLGSDNPDYFDLVYEADLAHPWYDKRVKSSNLPALGLAYFSPIDSYPFLPLEYDEVDFALFEVGPTMSTEFTLTQMYAYRRYLETLATTLSQMKIPGVARIWWSCVVSSDGAAAAS